MDMFALFKSVLEQDTEPVMICDTAHKIVYMNPAACEEFSRSGGKALLGKSVLDCHKPQSIERIQQVLRWFAEDVSHNRVRIAWLEKEQKDLYMVALRDEAGQLLGYYEKHAVRTRDVTPLYQF